MSGLHRLVEQLVKADRMLCSPSRAPDIEAEADADMRSASKPKARSA